MHDHLAGFPVIIEQPVAWGEQDPFGHVNNVVYFRWMESARIDYFRQANLGTTDNKTGYGPILASIKCDFRRQLNFPDTIRIGARVARIGRTSLTMTHRVESQSQKAIVAEAESTLVVFDYASGKPHPVPEALRKAIEKTEGRTFESGR